jgi:hypothetical protein
MLIFEVKKLQRRMFKSVLLNMSIKSTELPFQLKERMDQVIC